MTLSTYTPSSNNGVVVAAPSAGDQSSKGVARIMQWAESAEAAHQLAEVLCRTSFCPEQFRNKPGEATGAILAGGEVGLSPMASLRAFDIIQGNAAPRALALRAVVLSFGHEIELVESGQSRCRMRGRRRGSEKWQEVTWTVERARGLGLLNKSNWKTQPGTMLVARATGEICRLVAADAILGIAYTAEELYDAEVEQQQPATSRKVQRQPPAPRQQVTAGPQDTAGDDADLLGEGEPQESVEAPPAPPVSAAQLRMLGAQWSRIGVTDDLERRTLTGLLVGRDLDTTKNMTVVEATGLIDTIKNLADRDALEVLLRSQDQAPAYTPPPDPNAPPAPEPEGWQEPKP